MQEWEDKCVEYEKLTKKIAEATCIWSTDKLGERIHVSHQCPKCQLEYRGRKFRIAIFEHPLPTDLRRLRQQYLNWDVQKHFQPIETQRDWSFLRWR